MSITSRKVEKRIQFKKIRSDSMPRAEARIFEQVSNALQLKIESQKLFGHLGLYWPLANEVDLRPLKDFLKIPLALPASFKDGHLSYHPWTTKPLIKDSNNIPAPLDNRVLNPRELGLLLIPAIAMDLNGYRLGYGGGFFDRLRTNKEWGSIPAFGVLPQACISLELLPREVWDIPLHGWMTEKGLTNI